MRACTVKWFHLTLIAGTGCAERNGVRSQAADPDNFAIGDDKHAVPAGRLHGRGAREVAERRQHAKSRAETEAGQGQSLAAEPGQSHSRVDVSGEGVAVGCFNWEVAEGERRLDRGLVDAANG